MKQSVHVLQSMAMSQSSSTANSGANASTGGGGTITGGGNHTHSALDVLLIVGRADEGVVSAELVDLLGVNLQDSGVVTALLDEGIVVSTSPVVIDVESSDDLSMDEEYVLLLRLQKKTVDENICIRQLWAHYGKMVRGIVEGLAVNNDFEWFEQMGLEYLYEAAVVHNVFSGNRLASYAKVVVRCRLLRLMNHNYLVYIPEETQIKLAKVMRYLSQRGIIEIDKHLMPRTVWTDEMIQQMASNLNLSEKEIHDLILLIPLRMIEPLMLDYEESDDPEKSDDLWDRSINIEKDYISGLDRDRLWGCIDKLPVEQRIAIAYREGFIDGQKWAIKEISARMSEILNKDITDAAVKYYLKKARLGVKNSYGA